jgi:hypothetical protein
MFSTIRLSALLNPFGASTCRKSRRETLLPCSVVWFRLWGLGFVPWGKEAWQKASAVRYEWLLLREAEGGFIKPCGLA